MVELVYGRIDQPTLMKAALKLTGNDCDKYVINKCAPTSSTSQMSPDEVPENIVSAVLEDRIELSTRGFSVRCSTN